MRMVATNIVQTVIAVAAIVFFCSMLSSCASIVPQAFDRNAEYLKQIKVSWTAYDKAGKQLSESSFEGVGVIPRAHRYDFKGELKVDADFVTWATCHQQQTAEKEGKSFKFTWVPTPKDLECGNELEIKTIEEKLNRNQSALIVVDLPEYTLRGDVECNGRVLGRATGVVACHAKQGLVQGFTFPAEVFVAPNPDRCLLKEGFIGKTFSFKMPESRCSIQINNGADRSSMFLMLRPYSDVILTGKGD